MDHAGGDSGSVHPKRCNNVIAIAERIELYDDIRFAVTDIRFAVTDIR